MTNAPSPSAGGGGEGWDAFLEDFHHQRPGITAGILNRSFANGITPYDWLSEAVPDTDAVIDVACGSGPLATRLASRWTGIDRSVSELALIPAGHRVVVGDSASLPFADGTADSVVCSMSLQVLQPLAGVLAEIARVLRPGGRLVAIVPGRKPLTLRDRWRYLRLIRAIGAGLAAPNDGPLGQLTKVMNQAGLNVVDDDCRRFAYQFDQPTVAENFVSSLYLRNVPPMRVAAANTLARSWIDTALGVPIRRFVCVRDIPGRSAPATFSRS